MAAPLAPAETDVVVDRALADLAEPAWRVTDLRRTGTRTPRADVVVVGPSGVFVIACARPQDKPRARAKLSTGLLDAAESLTQLAGVRRDEVHPVLCLTGDGAVSGWSGGVTVCAVADLVETITFRRGLLSPAEVDEAARRVRHSMAARGRHRA